MKTYEFDTKNENIDSPKKAKLEKKRKKQRKRRFWIMILSMLCLIITISVTTNALKEVIVDVEIEQPSLEVDPTRFHLGDKKEDFITILIAITDQDELRTDALVLCSYDKLNQNIELLNIPRDTYCDATSNSKKINSAYVLGISNTMKTVSELVGFMPDKYIIANFNGLVEIIDSIGGVLIDVPIDMKYDDPTQDLHINIEKGLQLLDGKNSVDFLRFRKNNNGTGYATGDLGRIEATQNFVDTLKNQLLSVSTILKVPQLATSIFSNVKTDLEIGEIIWLGTNGLSINSLNSQTLPGVAKYINGISYYVVDTKETSQIINEKFNPYIDDIK